MIKQEYLTICEEFSRALHIIEQEISWCKADIKDNGPSEFKRGFLMGLQQVKSLLSKGNREKGI